MNKAFSAFATILPLTCSCPELGTRGTDGDGAGGDHRAAGCTQISLPTSRIQGFQGAPSRDKENTHRQHLWNSPIHTVGYQDKGEMTPSKWSVSPGYSWYQASNDGFLQCWINSAAKHLKVREYIYINEGMQLPGYCGIYIKRNLRLIHKAGLRKQLLLCLMDSNKEQKAP